VAHLQSQDSVRADENKSPQDILLSLQARYRTLSEEDRTIIDQLLSDQLSFEDEDVRFCALTLIHEFRITSAVPALRRLADWLETHQWPGAPYEWTKVNQLAGRLLETQGPLSSPRDEAQPVIHEQSTQLMTLRLS